MNEEVYNHVVFFMKNRLLFKLYYWINPHVGPEVISDVSSNVSNKCHDQDELLNNIYWSLLVQMGVGGRK